MSPDAGKHYDELAPIYQAVWGDRLHHGLWLSRRDSRKLALDQMEALIRKRAAILPGDRVVDIGCGQGVLARDIARDDGAIVTGITLSRSQWDFASHLVRDTPERLSFIHGDWLNNDLPDNSQEVAISMECVSHVEDKPGFFREVYRTLSPGGHLVMTCWMARRGVSEIARTLVVNPVSKAGALAGLCDPSQYADLLKEAGLEPVEYLDLSSEAGWTWSHMLLRFMISIVRYPSLILLCLRRPVRSWNQAWTIPGLILAYHAGWIGHGLWVARKL